MLNNIGLRRFKCLVTTCRCLTCNNLRGSNKHVQSRIFFSLCATEHEERSISFQLSLMFQNSTHILAEVP